MKRLTSLALCVVLLMTTVCFASSSWTCPNCGRSGLTDNFCPNCGSAKPISENYGNRNANSSVYAGNTVMFGAYEQDGNYSNGAEPIEWTVLSIENSRALLVSKYVLKWDYFNYGGSLSSWNDSSICYWLNDSFMNSAFTYNEKNALYSNYSSAAQKVFLLSEEEVRRYMGTVISRMGYPTRACANEGAYTWATGACDWWLRDTMEGFDYSNGKKYRFAECIKGSGDYDLNGQKEHLNRRGVRPAVWVSIDAL